MSVMLQRLGFFDPSGSLFANIQSDTPIATRIASLSAEARLNLVSHHAQINFEYSVLCSKIAREWAAARTGSRGLSAGSSAVAGPLDSADKPRNVGAGIEPELREQALAALKTAELLEVLYQCYLDSPRERDRLQHEQKILKKWLNGEEHSITKPLPKTYTSKAIRETTSNINLPRLFVVRLRRLLLAIAPLTHEVSFYRQSINHMDRYAAPFFSNLSWLIFIPRIADNLAMVIKHTVAYRSMSEEEKALGWQKRLKIQLNARWPDLTNDLPWFIANLISCFVLTGALAPYSAAFSMGMQCYEIAQASMQYFIETAHLCQQRRDYLNLLNNAKKGSEEYRKIEAYIHHLDLRIDYESRRLFIPIINTTVLLIALILAAPFLAFNSLFAVLGGAIAVLTTIVSYQAREQLKKQKPADNLFELLNQPRFFKPTQPVDQSGQCPSLTPS